MSAPQIEYHLNSVDKLVCSTTDVKLSLISRWAETDSLEDAALRQVGALEEQITNYVNKNQEVEKRCKKLELRLLKEREEKDQLNKKLSVNIGKNHDLEVLCQKVDKINKSLRKKLSDLENFNIKGNSSEQEIKEILMKFKELEESEAENQKKYEESCKLNKELHAKLTKINGSIQDSEKDKFDIKSLKLKQLYLEEKNQELEQKCENLQNILKEKDSIKTEKGESKEVTDRIHVYESEMKELEERCKSLEKRVAKEREEKQSVQNNLEDKMIYLNRKIDLEIARNKGLTKQLNSVTQDFNSVEKELQEMKASSSQQVTVEKNDLFNAERIKALEDKLYSQEKEKKDLNDQNKNLREQISINEEKIKTLEEKVSLLEEDNKVTQDKNESLMEEQIAHGNKIKSLEERLISIQKEKESVQEDNQSLRETNTELKQNFISKEEEYKAKIKSLAKLKDLSESNDESDSKYKVELKKWEEEKKNYFDTIALLKQNAAQQHKAVKKSKTIIDSLAMEQIKLIESSSSTQIQSILDRQQEIQKLAVSDDEESHTSSDKKNSTASATHNSDKDKKERHEVVAEAMKLRKEVEAELEPPMKDEFEHIEHQEKIEQAKPMKTDIKKRIKTFMGGPEMQ